MDDFEKILLSDPDTIEQLDNDHVHEIMHRLGIPPSRALAPKARGRLEEHRNLLFADSGNRQQPILFDSPGSWCPQKRQAAIAEITDWLGRESLDRLLPLTGTILFSETEKSRQHVYADYNLHPGFPLSETIQQRQGLVFNIRLELGLTSDDGLSFWQLYTQLVARRTFQRINRQYSLMTHDRGNACRSLMENLWEWLRAFARLPIRKEVLRIASRMVSANDYMSTRREISKIRPVSILYSLFMALCSHGLRVVYCGYRINPHTNGRATLSWHCGNETGRNGRYYRRLADKCLEILGPEHSNSAYFLDSNDTGIQLTFPLFCIRTASQLILLGIDGRSLAQRISLEPSDSSIQAAKFATAEAIALAGFEYRRDTLLKIQHRDGTPEIAVSPIGNVIFSPCPIDANRDYLSRFFEHEDRLDKHRFIRGAQEFDNLIDVMQFEQTRELDMALCEQGTVSAMPEAPQRKRSKPHGLSRTQPEFTNACHYEQ